MSHEYAYLYDSNRHLSYNFDMFNTRNGQLNNTGMRTILTYLRKTTIRNIMYYYKNNQIEQENTITLNDNTTNEVKDESDFFRF